MKYTLNKRRPRRSSSSSSTRDFIVLATIAVALLVSNPVNSFTSESFGISSRWGCHSNLMNDDAVFCGIGVNSNPLPSTKLRMSSVDDEDDKKERTLYEILGASQDDTRSELKRKYIALARVSHPDALIGDNADGDVDFQKIAEAWRTLGNPKDRRRYDRQLKAKAWGEAAQKLTNERLEQVAPVASSFMDNLAVPFLKRTSKAIAKGIKATTVVSAAASAAAVAAAKTDAVEASMNISKNADVSSDEESLIADVQAGTTNEEEGEIADGDGAEKEESIDETDLSNRNGMAEAVTPAVAETFNTVAAVEEEVEATFVETTNETPDEWVNGVNTDGSIPEEQIISEEEAEELLPLAVDDAVFDAVTPEELNEPLEEIQEQVKNEEQRIKTIQEELDAVKEQRLFASLQSEKYPISSCEAKDVLEKISTNETVSFVHRSTKKTIIEKEILSLRNTEEQFTKKLESYSEIDREWNDWLTKQEDAKKLLTEKREDEREARKALVKAEEMVVIADQDFRAVSNKLRGVEQDVRKSAIEMEKVSTTLSLKQERVRNALRRKTELMKGGISVQYITEEEVRLLRRKETQLMGESKQIAIMVARLQSRADKLKERAAELEQLKSN